MTQDIARLRIKYEMIINEAMRPHLSVEDHIGEDITDNTYEWCAGSVTPQIDELQNLFKSWRILLSSERADEFRPPVSGGGSGNVRQQEAGRICYDDLSYSRIVDIIANLLRY